MKDLPKGLRTADNSALCSGCGRRFRLEVLDTRHVTDADGEWVRQKPGLWCQDCYEKDGSTGYASLLPPEESGPIT